MINKDIWLLLCYFKNGINSTWAKGKCKQEVSLKKQNKITIDLFKQLLFFCEKDKFEVNVTLPMKYCQASWPWKVCQHAASFGLP